MYKRSATTKFAAAHFLRGYNGACENLHVHNWIVKATLARNELNNIGIAFDFKLLKKYLHEIMDQFDHKFLNEVPPFDKINPTSENMAKYVFDSLSKKLPNNIKVTSIEVGESEKYLAIYEQTC